MNLKKNIGLFPAAALLIAICYYFLDKRIALFVKKNIMDGLLSSNVPDFLFPIVCILSIIGWAAYFYRRSKGVYNIETRFFQLIAITLPLAFALKSALKYVFGRTDARFWLRYPRSKEFHWFHGGGNYSAFPSGHMAVFTALLVTTAELYPRYRTFCYGLLAVLAVALVCTNYHYLSDVIAGAYLGLFVHSAASHAFPLRFKPETRPH